MSGLGGHIMHLYEDNTLTFGDLKNIAKDLCTSAINVTEKVDGVNIFFNYDFSTDDIRIARNKSMLLRGGLDEDGVRRQWPDVHLPFGRVFIESIGVLKNFIKKHIRRELMESIFGNRSGKEVWFSAEIIHPELANVIYYGKKAIVFHCDGIVIDHTGNILRQSTNIKPHFDLFMKSLESKYYLLDNQWRILKPIDINKQINDNLDYYHSLLHNFNRNLDHIMEKWGITNENTIFDFFRKRMSGYLQKSGFTSDTELNAALNTIFEKKGINEVESLLNYESITYYQYDLVKKIYGGKYYYKFLRPLEKCIFDFSVKFLKPLHSSLMSKGESYNAIKRIKIQLKKAISNINKHGNQEIVDQLTANAAKIGNIDDLYFGLEGVVFQWNNKKYKLTGYFAPINKIYNINKNVSIKYT